MKKLLFSSIILLCGCVNGYSQNAYASISGGYTPKHFHASLYFGHSIGEHGFAEIGYFTSGNNFYVNLHAGAIIQVNDLFSVRPFIGVGIGIISNEELTNHAIPCFTFGSQALLKLDKGFYLKSDLAMQGMKLFPSIGLMANF